MKKSIITHVVFLFTCLACINTSQAQVSAGLTLGMFKPSTEGAEAHLGFNLSGKYDINDNIRVGANLGYYFKTIDVLGAELTSFAMPITGLFEYSFNDNDFSPYIGADLGIYRLGISGDGASLSTSNFGLASVVGFNYNLSDNLAINANAKYHYIMTEVESTSAIGVNAGIGLKF